MSARVCVLLLATFAVSNSGFAQDADQLQWLVNGTPDPAAIHAHDGSGDFIFATGKGIAIWRSSDRKNWKRVGRVFDQDVPGWAHKLIPKADSVWAPDIQYANGKYYLYYSVSTFGSQRSVIGLAVNSTLNPKHRDYKWEDRGLVVESFPEKDDFNAIDPAMFVDGQKAYLVWGSYWTGIKGTEINLATGKPNSTSKIVPIASRADAASTAIEGAYVIKRGDYFYLFVSWDFCCAREKSTYKVMLGRSKTALGPYVDHLGRKMTDGGGTLLLMSDRRWRGPGHNSILRVGHQDWIVYHVVDGRSPNKGRILKLRSLTWDKEWPILGPPLEHPVIEPAFQPSVVGRWMHTVDDSRVYDIFFEPSGEITGTKGKSEWELKGESLLMKWHDPKAPGCMWIDEVKIDLKAKTYAGKNQIGTTIDGSQQAF